MPWLVQGALGVLLFWHADLLVDSPAFRLSSGTAGFVLLSTLIITFVIYRRAFGMQVKGPRAQSLSPSTETFLQILGLTALRAVGFQALKPSTRTLGAGGTDPALRGCSREPLEGAP